MKLSSSFWKDAAGKKVCVLLSGGLDSCVLAAILAQHNSEVFPLYVRGGLVWEQAELHGLRQFFTAISLPGIGPIVEIDLPVADVYKQHWSTTGQAAPDYHSPNQAVYLPGRNLLMLSKAALYCSFHQITVIALGTLKGNPFSDSTPKFLSSFSDLASQALSFPIKVMTPFTSYAKPEVIQLGRELPLHLSFSCIHPVGLTHCGMCNKCAERRSSFQAAGILDRTEYHSLPALIQPNHHE